MNLPIDFKFEDGKGPENATPRNNFQSLRFWVNFDFGWTDQVEIENATLRNNFQGLGMKASI